MRAGDFEYDHVQKRTLLQLHVTNYDYLKSGAKILPEVPSKGKYWKSLPVIILHHQLHYIFIENDVTPLPCKTKPQKLNCIIIHS